MVDEQAWWIRLEDEVMGPYTFGQMEELARSRHVRADTPCSSDRVAWTAASDRFPFSWDEYLVPQRRRQRPRDSWARRQEALERPMAPDSIWVTTLILLLGCGVGFYQAFKLLTLDPELASRVGGNFHREARVEGLAWMLIAFGQLGLTWVFHRGHEWARLAILGMFLVALISDVVPRGGRWPPVSIWAIALHLCVVVALLRSSARAFTRDAAVRRRTLAQVRAVSRRRPE